MNLADNPSRVDKDVTVGSCRISCLLSANDLVLLAASEEGLQHALDRFSAVCDQPGVKISTKIPRCYVSPETQGSVCFKLAALHCRM